MTADQGTMRVRAGRRAPALCMALAVACAMAVPASAASDRIDLVERLRQGRDAGARAVHAGLPVLPVGLEEVALAARTRNFDGLAASEQMIAARARVLQREAAWDPTVFGSLSYTWADSRLRAEDVGRLRDQDAFGDEETDSQGEPLDVPLAAGVCKVEIDGEDTVSGLLSSGEEDDNSCFQGPVYSVEQEFASSSSLTRHTVAGSLGVNLKARFGGQATLSVGSTWRKKYSFQAPTLTLPLGVDDPFGWGDAGLFWTSTASASISTPLPWTKGFGRDGNPDVVNLRLAQTGVTRAQWTGRAARNSAVAQAMLVWWDMVEAAESLHTLVAFQSTLSRRLTAQRRLFDEGLNTAYDVAQVEAQIVSLRTQEELTWSGLLQAGARLRTMVGAEREVVLVPADPKAALEAPPPEPDVLAESGLDLTLYDRALAYHPDMHLRRIDVDASRITLDFRRNQALPDITLTASASVGQVDSAYGYNNIGNSLAHLGKPDNSSLFVGLRFRMPLGNVAAESQLTRARIAERQAFDRMRQTERQIADDMDVAISAQLSARAQVEQALDDRDLARVALERAVDLRDQGLVSEFEVLSRLSEILSAELAITRARGAEHKARVRFLAAQGILGEEVTR